MFLFFLCVITRYVSWQVYGILCLVSASQTQISLCHNLLLGCHIILRFCIEHDSITAMLRQLSTMIECACSVAASACWKQSRNKRVDADRCKQMAKGFSSFLSCNFIRVTGQNNPTPAVDCADLQCFLVNNSCICISVADRLLKWFGLRCYFKTYAL